MYFSNYFYQFFLQVSNETSFVKTPPVAVDPAATALVALSPKHKCPWCPQSYQSKG